MLFWIIVKVALRSLLANKLRSVLAVLGIIIGVAAVISMLAIGAGAQHEVLSRIQSMGTNLLIVRPGQRGSMGVMSGTQQNLTLEDAEAMLKVPGVGVVSPVVSGSAQLKYFSRNARSTVMGVAVPFFGARNYEIDRGDLFGEMDVEHHSRSAVIGPVVAENLFAAEDPIGQVIKVNGVNFRVIGLLKAKGDQGYYNPDDQIFVPYTTAMRQVFGVDYLREIDVQAAEDADLAKVSDAMLQAIRKRHRLQPETPDDVYVRNMADLADTYASASRTFTLLLGSVAGISLLVGGIGIMNIMLVTVTERTREIGIRKAIGAKERDILGQFLIEAMLMSAIGGLVGVGLGVLTSRVMAAWPETQFKPIVEPLSILLALGFSGMVGIFFGYYPARRAAKLDPIEALRYE